MLERFRLGSRIFSWVLKDLKIFYIKEILEDGFGNFRDLS